MILKKSKLILLIILNLILLSTNLYSTEQYPDKVIYKNKIYTIDKYPLEDFFNKNPLKRPIGISTALHRGYVATFEIKDEKLFLKNIEIEVRNSNLESLNRLKWKSIITDIVPIENLIEIICFEGILVMSPKGKSFQFREGKENTIVAELIDGELIFFKEFRKDEFVEFKNEQFKAFKKTKEYREYFKEMKRECGLERKAVKETIYHLLFNLIDTIEK